MAEKKYGPRVDKLASGDASGWTAETLNDHINTLESLRDLGTVDGAEIEERIAEARATLLRLKKAPRDYRQERKRARGRKAASLATVRSARDSGELGDEIMKVAQVLTLCGLPYKPTSDRQITRSARLSDGSTLSVTFSAGLDGVALPFGADRNLMTWLFDKAIQRKSAFISVKTASEFLIETGKTTGGRDFAELADRMRRLSGLVVGIQRQGSKSHSGATLPIVESFNLPKSFDRALSSDLQVQLPGMEDSQGIKLQDTLFLDMLEHNVVIPRALWLALQEAGGSVQQQDLLLFFLYRLYSARKESVVPSSAFREQYGTDDSNPRRLKQTVRRVLTQLKFIWPEARIEIIEIEDGWGVSVAPARQQLLPDDPEMKRVRRIGA
jgi:hypothetical protein